MAHPLIILISVVLWLRKELVRVGRNALSPRIFILHCESKQKPLVIAPLAKATLIRLEFQFALGGWFVQFQIPASQINCDLHFCDYRLC